MNYMPEVLKMLGVEVGEKFKIKGIEGKVFEFDKYYLLDHECKYLSGHELICNLIKGRREIEKLPWKPKLDDYYYFVDANGGLSGTDWRNHAYDYILYNTGNYFKTKEEITPELKERILREMKEKYDND